MTSSLLLFGANVLTWAEIIAGVVIAIIYVFNHLITVAAKQQRRQVRPEMRPDHRGPRPAGKPDAQDEVAEFLRRAAEKRSATKTGEARPLQSATVPERVDPRIVEMRAAAQKRQAANRSTAAVPAEIIEARAVEPLPSSRWPNPVQSHVDTRELAERVGHLTHVDRTEAAFQAHMQSLDHPVGRIADVTGSQPAPAAGTGQTTPAPMLSDLFASLLSDPQNLRQAIILNEIIERPVERW
jgi:hypothetical protein